MITTLRVLNIDFYFISSFSFYLLPYFKISYTQSIEQIWGKNKKHNLEKD